MCFFFFTVEGDCCLLLRKVTMFYSRQWWTFWIQACGQAWSQDCGHHKVLSSFYNSFSHSLLINIITIQAFLHSDMQHLIGEGEPSLSYLIQPLTHPTTLSSLLSLCILPVPSSFSHLGYPVVCRRLWGIWSGSVCSAVFVSKKIRKSKETGTISCPHLPRLFLVVFSFLGFFSFSVGLCCLIQQLIFLLLSF
jgi:hypothetical protein